MKKKLIFLAFLVLFFVPNLSSGSCLHECFQACKELFPDYELQVPCNDGCRFGCPPAN